VAYQPQSIVGALRLSAAISSRIFHLEDSRHGSLDALWIFA
jgi:hypothetical protein